jgi:ribosomal protein L40E
MGRIIRRGAIESLVSRHEEASMALVACKECGAKVAAAAPTCPKCGVSRPGAATGKLVIMRSSAMTAAMYAVQVVVDGQLMGEVKNGGTITLDLPAGQRKVEVRGGGMSRAASIRIVDGQTTRYQMYFSAWGFLGGGLNFKPA